MALGQSAGVIFTIKANSADAEAKIKKFQADLKGLEKANNDQGTSLQRLAAMSGITAEKFADMGSAATSYFAIIGAGVTITTAFVATLFKLSTTAAEYGSAIFDASEKTGLTAESLSAMQVAAEQSGASLDQVTNGIARFSKLVGDAAEGSDKAAASLKKFGLDPQDSINDLEGSLEKVFKRIVAAKSGTEQLALAQAAFGRSGADLLPFIKSFDGDITKLTEKMRGLGRTIDDDAARQMDEFGDQMDDLSGQLKMVGVTIGLEVMPAFSRMATTMSNFLVKNKGEVKSWAEAWENSLNDMVNAFSNLERIFTSGTWQERIFYLMGTLFPNSAYGIGLSALNAGQSGAGTATARIGGSAKVGKSDLFNDDDKKADEAAKEAERRRKEAEALAKRDLNAAIGSARNNLGLDIEDVAETLDQITAKLRDNGNTDKWFEHLNKEFTRLKTNIELSLDSLEKLENKQRDSMTVNERSLLTQEQRIRRDKELAIVEKARADFEEARIDIDKDGLEASLKRLDAEIERTKELIRLEAEREKNAPENNFGKPPIPMPKEGWDVEGDPREGWGQFDKLFDDFKDNDAAIAGIEAMQTAFEGLAQAISQTVTAWILYGTVGQTAQQVTAQIIAAIAQQATVKAIFELAEGFAALARAFFGDPKAGAEAAMHFKSAAIYGSVAAIAAVTGRAVAGDSFSKAAGGSGSGSGSSTEERGEPQTFSRESDDTYQSGRRPKEQGRPSWTNPWTEAAAAIKDAATELHGATKPLKGMRPGEVLARGAEQVSKDFFLKRTTEGVKANAGAARDMKQRLG